ncbi:MAG: hypothetical protein F6K47_23700 [Symploca sp. SIO2E6]|nr:hypothetical protein [Symploca sp. SIO2E6]
MLNTFSGPENLDWTVRFKSNEQLIASAIDGKTVILWNLYRLDDKQLLERACIRLQDYLKNNSSVEHRDDKPLWEDLWDDLNNSDLGQSDRNICSE